VFSDGLPDGERLDRSDLLFTSYALYNVVARCADPAHRPHTFLMQHDTILDTTGLTAFELLVEQARRGGIVERPLAIERALSSSTVIEPMLRERRPARVVYYFPLCDCASNLGRIPIASYRLESCRAGVFVFQRTP